MTLNSRSTKLSSPNVKIQDVPNVPTIGTPTQAGDNINVAFTPATTGGQAAVYRAVSSPGGIEATSFGSSPISVAGLNGGTAYTFTVRGETSTGATTGYSSASSSVTTDFGAYQQIATTVMTGNTGNVVFSSIPSGYRHLQIRMVARNAEAITGLRGLFINFNGDSSTTCATHYMYGNASSIISGYQSDNRINAGGWSLMPTVNLTSGAFFSGVIDILDYSSTSKNKTLRLLGGTNTSTASTVGLMSGLWPSTAAINNIEMYSNGAWVSGSRFSLYGIKG
jgi:hypothetical protein